MVQDQRPCRSPGGCLGLWSVRWGESQVPGGQPPPASMFSYACPSQTQDAVSAQVGCFRLLCAMQAVPRPGRESLGSGWHCSPFPAPRLVSQGPTCLQQGQWEPHTGRLRLCCLLQPPHPVLPRQPPVSLRSTTPEPLGARDCWAKWPLPPQFQQDAAFTVLCP